MRRNFVAIAMGLLAAGALLISVGVGVGGAASSAARFERHQFSVAISWSQETAWEYKYARSFAGTCDGNSNLQRRETKEGSGNENWRLTSRRPGLLNVWFSKHPYYRGRPALSWATRHTVDLVRERSGSLESALWCGTRALLPPDKASRSKCGRVAFPIFMTMEIPLGRKNVVDTEIWPAGNRSWQREKAMVKDCPNPPDYFGGMYADPGKEPREVAGTFGMPLVFLVPIRWDALKNRARKRFVIPLKYSGTFTYPQAQPSDEPGETKSQTGKLTTVAVGKIILTRKK